MTRDEINRKISEIRNEWTLLNDGEWVPCDWGLPVNVLTLLKEMPAPYLWLNPDTSWTLEFELPAGEFDFVNATSVEAAICEAWLKWKKETS